MKAVSNIIVSSWDEWSPLKHVIIGRADGGMVQAPEPAVSRQWPNWGYPLGTFGQYPQEMIDKANEQLDNFARILNRRGIMVDRPTPLAFDQEVATPDWKQGSMVGCMPARDLLLTVGNEILEATMSFRSRWYEYLCYRPLLNQYFAADPNFRHEAAPKPRLTERTWKRGFYSEWSALTDDQKRERMASGDWILTEEEPCFDAADVARFGRDLFVQKSMQTNDSGIRWLRQHFPQHRVHVVKYFSAMPWHIDTTLVPLRPGLVMINPARKAATREQAQLFEMNGWEVIVAPTPARTEVPPMTYCTVWLSLNLLVLDPKTVCVEAGETGVQELLDKHGFDVIPVPFWDVAPFGGGLHCATADVYRIGNCEDYLPKQISGF